MSGGDENPAGGQVASDSKAVVALGRKRHDSGQNRARRQAVAPSNRHRRGRIASRGCAPRYPSRSFRNGPSMWMPAIRRAASGSALAQRCQRRQPTAHRARSSVMIVARKPRHAVRLEPFARAVQLVGVQVVLVEVHAGIAVDLQNRRKRRRRHRAAWPASPGAYRQQFIIGPRTACGWRWRRGRPSPCSDQPLPRRCPTDAE